ncbi:WLM domain-containing protein [Lasiosphaeris hirsuta]|uniref:WLM domain-containing protein n=1 Tax=Lasiosphaeris hirsuta TaxID=260670 RepID=A0AA40DML0_9PEZI|nr:WLM domain-containing protein [Lasiosphaeris hirsuta]
MASEGVHSNREEGSNQRPQTSDADAGPRVKSSDDDGFPYAFYVKFGPENYHEQWVFEKGATVKDVLFEAALVWPAYDWVKCKIIVGKRTARGQKMKLESPKDLEDELDILNGNSIRFITSKIVAKDELEQASRSVKEVEALRNSTRGKRPETKRNTGPVDSYTFQIVRPLTHLPNPERSMAFLQRLKADPGIKTAMRKHKFRVGLLTEMDPAEYTSATHEGTTRILGLNRNFGEVIELRLRTDAGDGYRDYKTIRKTLCHELSHNVHGNHDKEFWKLTHEIEKQVHDADWLSGGRTVGNEEYKPDAESDASFIDDRTWVGGSYLLGGNSGLGADSGSTAGLSRREILARAAEARLRSIGKANSTAKERDGGNDQDPDPNAESSS